MLGHLSGDMGLVTSTLDPEVEEGDCRYMPKEILNEVMCGWSSYCM